MKKSKLFESFSYTPDRTDFPHFEINGTFQLLADGCRGILYFDENRLSLNCGEIVLEIEGENLTVNYLNENTAEVKGKISSVKLK